MVFGFGFNKTKVLSAAERYVQQGKLQNAIAEYEKIAKEDPKDLTVLNTIGDLYARVGQAERAASYFRKVGDAYAADGFTVKAIAMYKKLTKLSPSATDCLMKLADLYTQQGLYNDARSQYVLVADQYMRSGDLDQSARIFQKMLELDPENSAMQSKLADLYVRLGKKTEARDIFFRAAESLYGRGALEGADESLARVLALEPGNSRALMLRGQIALDSGDGATAIKHLEKIPQIDSMSDGLAALLRAHLTVGDLQHAEPVAKKLLTVHNDLSGMHTYADALIAAGNCERALHVYNDYADRLLAADPAGMVAALRSTIGRVKDSPAALEILRGVFQKSGDSTHIAEVNELLAHALVQSGNLQKASELYKELAELEPENPLHSQNYKQIISRMGQDTVARPLSQEEGQQALMAEELEFTAPALEQRYPEEVAGAVNAALTDSELFDSYSVPAKAIAPLEAVLPQAPHDARLNQRLASLYTRAERFADAARCCVMLQKLYTSAGLAAQAQQYAEMAAKYAERAGLGAPPAVAEIPAAAAATVAPEVPETPLVREADAATGVAGVEVPPGFVAEAALPAFQVELAPAIEPAPAPLAHEIDLSDEWESAMVVEPPTPAEAAAQVAPAPPALEPEAAAQAAFQPEAVESTLISDLIEEARFYTSQSMWEEARTALARCEEVAGALPELEELKQRLAAAAAAPAEAVPEVELAEDVEPAPEAEVEPTPAAETAKATVSEFVFDATAVGLPAPKAPEIQLPAEPVVKPPISPPPAMAPQAAAAPAMAKADTLGAFASELEAALPADYNATPARVSPLPVPVTEAPAATPVAAAGTAPAPEPPPAFDNEASSALSDMFAEFKEDVEAGAEQEDPETHYNLGVAFKEMGLLDEAIGELQKVCHAIDHGQPFAQVMQAYTWLAQCFVEKGVPEAGIRWYEKALKLPADDDSRTALHYELACACEAAGNRTTALSHFMEVYGTNIDYRDVAERIKALKS